MEKFQVFVENIEKIKNLNAAAPYATFAINKFADLSSEEFRQKYLGSRRSQKVIADEDVLVPTVTGALDPSFDWRTLGAVTDVKDQQQCGSCWAFSAVENVESVWILSGKGSNKTVQLSEQQVVDCDQTDAGCNGGDTPSAFQYIMDAGGIESEDDYPYQGYDGSCSFNKAKIAATISSYRYATKNNDEKVMQANLASWAPLSICVDAAAWQFYSGGVFDADSCGTDLDHCVQVVGYDTTQTPNFWIVRNSWNTDWGMAGYILLEMWKDTCGVAMEATTAVV